MNNDKLLYGVVGLVLGLLVAGFFTSYAVNGNHGRMMRMMGIRYNDSGGMMGNNFSSMMSNNIDQHFIEQMIPHHDDAITMANIALQKAEHQEIKDLAQNIVKAQTEEIDNMRQWYKTWFGADVPDTFAGMGGGMGLGMMHGGMMGNDADISDFESAQPFDKEFIAQMIPHHQMAVMMAQMLKSSTIRSEMKQLAEDIISAQTREIDQMRGWYQTWYK